MASDARFAEGRIEPGVADRAHYTGADGRRLAPDPAVRRRGPAPTGLAEGPRVTTSIDSGRVGRQPEAWRFRHVTWNFAQRDLKSKYKNTVLGWGWSLLVPLATVAIYTLVFSVFFRSVPPNLGNGASGIFSLWFFTALVAWSYLTASITRGMSTLVGSGRLLKKIYLPGYVPVLGSLIAGCVQMLIELAILLAIMVVLGNAGWTWLLLPVWFVVFLPFVVGLTLLTALANIYVRDLSVIISVVLQLLFFLTPIIYQVSMIPESLHGVPVRALIEASPLSGFVASLRDLVYLHTLPSAGSVAWLLAWSAAALAAAVWAFRRGGRDLAERV